MPITQIIDKDSVYRALANTEASDLIRITFREDTAHMMGRISELRSTFMFDEDWLVQVATKVVPEGNWGEVRRSKYARLAVSTMSEGRCRAVADILADITESIEVNNI